MAKRTEKIIKGRVRPHKEMKKRTEKKVFSMPRVEQRREKKNLSGGSSAAEIEFPHRSRICFSFECATLFHHSGASPAATWSQKSAANFTGVQLAAFMQIARALNFWQNEKLSRRARQNTKLIVTSVCAINSAAGR
jgi:hypothetical protein